MSETFWFQLVMMLLGFTLPILFRALNHAGTKFTLYRFFYDQRTRFLVGVAIIAILQTILYFQPEFIEAARGYGLAIPVAVSSACGLGVGVFVVKAMRTATAAAQG